MNSYVEVIDDQTVRLERLLPGPIERVWDYITDGEKRAKWLAGGEFDLTVGGPIKLEFHNASLSPELDDPPPPHHSDLPERMYFDGEVTRCEPPTLLAHTWNEGDRATEVEYRSMSPLKRWKRFTSPQGVCHEPKSSSSICKVSANTVRRSSGAD